MDFHSSCVLYVLHLLYSVSQKEVDRECLFFCDKFMGDYSQTQTLLKRTCFYLTHKRRILGLSHFVFVLHLFKENNPFSQLSTEWCS